MTSPIKYIATYGSYMCRLSVAALIVVTAGGLPIGMPSVQAANFVTVQDGGWRFGLTWGFTGSVEGVDYPGPNDNATILGHRVYVDQPGQTVNDVTLQAGSILDLGYDLVYLGRGDTDSGTITGIGSLVPKKTTWYVRPIRKWWECNAIHDGKSMATAFNDMGNIDWTRVNENDEILLVTVSPENRCTDEGDFLERGAAIQASGKPGYPIVIRSIDPNKPTLIKPANRTPAFSSKALYNTHDIEIRDVRIDQCEGDNVCPIGDSIVQGNGHGIFFREASNIRINNVEVYNSTDGITFTGPNNVVVENCKVSNFFGNGIAFKAGFNGGGGGKNYARNNEVEYSYSGDGITVHETGQSGTLVLHPDARFYILGNSVSFANEEGLDLTSGNHIEVRGNLTHDNTHAAVISHSARNVTYIGNRSYNEGGVLFTVEDDPQELFEVVVAGNEFDTRNSLPGAACFNLARNPNTSKISIYNNTCVSGSVGLDSAILVKADAGTVEIRNNIIAIETHTGYFARFFGLPVGLNTTFSNNLWYHPGGSTALTFCQWVAGRGCVDIYSFDDFVLKENVNDTLFGPPLFSNSVARDFTLIGTSPAIDAGTDMGLTVDGIGNPIYGAPDIGAYEFQPGL